MFHPAVVPLPVHMGIPDEAAKGKASAPSKWANAELMKIPNFLHLTPPAIKSHCRALKQFCTPWPKELTTDEECVEHFPFEYVFTDYVHAAPTIRDVRARVVKLQFRLSSLPLDYHAKVKMKRLLNSKSGERYDEKTDMVTIVADRCPLKVQNYDYINYLVTAVFFESWVSIYMSLLQFSFNMICILCFLHRKLSHGRRRSSGVTGNGTTSKRVPVSIIWSSI
jgi:small subunit ribosomal protein S35